MNEKRPTQEQQILALLAERGEEGMTPGDALNEVGCFRLAARIANLRALGHNIVTEPYKTRNGARVAKYILRPAVPTRYVEPSIWIMEDAR